MPQRDQDRQREPASPRRKVHSELLLALVGMLVAQSFLTETSIAARAVMNVMFLALILSGIRSLSGSRRRLVGTLLIGMAAFVVSCVTEFNASMFVEVLVYVCYVVVFSSLLLSLCESVFTEGPVDSNRIVGAISIYFVLGLIWAFAYTLLEVVAPGSFAINSKESDMGVNQRMISEFLYFSNVTLTTLGYGDIVPISRPAQMLATLQAMFGQLYLTVVVARLVGLHISYQRTGSPPDSAVRDSNV